MNTDQSNNENNVTAFQLVMLVLSIYVLGALTAEVMMKIPPKVEALLEVFDTAICCVFLGDFFYRLYHAQNRLVFMKWGWIDFVSSIPMVSAFRWGRAIRIVRILRILRTI